MNELDRVAFLDAAGIVEVQLMLVEKQPVRGRFAFEECDGSFDSPDSSDERTGQERDDAEVGDEKRNVMFFPPPARKG